MSDLQNSSPAGPMVRVKIFGVGKAGGAMLEHMSQGDFRGATFIGVNVNSAKLPASVEQIYLETKLLRGLGTSGEPERGRKAAEEHFQKLKELCGGADVVFIVAGLGGGAGTGISPVLARAAKEVGALTLAFVSLPFALEGNHRQHQAQEGLEQLKRAANGVICLANQKAAKTIDEHISLLEMFGHTTQLLVEGVRGVWRLLTHRGLIEIHFNELSALLREGREESCFAAVEAAGTTRARDAIEKLVAHPLLDGGAVLKDADAVLISLMGGPDLSMADVNRVMEEVNEQCKKAKVIMGAAVDEAFRDRLSVTLIAARNRIEKIEAETTRSSEPADEESPGFESELLHKTESKRSPSRVVPPAPALTTEQREELIAKHSGKSPRGRKNGPRMRQTMFQLDVVSKGRFDKTEPTIHRGEDLDLPTYIRRGVALN